MTFTDHHKTRITRTFGHKRNIKRLITHQWNRILTINWLQNIQTEDQSHCTEEGLNKTGETKYINRQLGTKIGTTS
jgi:hypothetical protein